MRIKNILLALSIAFFSARATAAGCMGLTEDSNLKSIINMSDSIRINGMDWGISRPYSVSQWLKSMEEKGVIVSTDYSAAEDVNCVSLHTVRVAYPDRILSLTFFGYPEKTEFDLNSLANGDDTHAAVNIFLDLGQFKDSLTVDGYTIKSDMTFEEFKKIFPLSASKNKASLLFEEWTAGPQTYIVGRKFKGYDQFCLDSGVEFTFSNGKLSGLALRDYDISPCSC